MHRASLTVVASVAFWAGIVACGATRTVPPPVTPVSLDRTAESDPSASKATSGQCEAACTNVRNVFIDEVRRRMVEDPDVKALGKAGAEMAEDMAMVQLDYLYKDCMTQCKDEATVSQSTCLTQAREMDELGKCH